MPRISSSQLIRNSDSLEQRLQKTPHFVSKSTYQVHSGTESLILVMTLDALNTIALPCLDFLSGFSGSPVTAKAKGPKLLFHAGHHRWAHFRHTIQNMCPGPRLTATVDDQYVMDHKSTDVKCWTLQDCTLLRHRTVQENVKFLSCMWGKHIQKVSHHVTASSWNCYATRTFSWSRILWRIKIYCLELRVDE